MRARFAKSKCEITAEFQLLEEAFMLFIDISLRKINPNSAEGIS